MDRIKTWSERAQEQAASAADDMILRFQARLQKALEELGNNESEKKLALANLFMDCMVGSVVLLASGVSSNSRQIEEAIVLGVRRHFSLLRSSVLSGVPKDPQIVNRSEVN